MTRTLHPCGVLFVAALLASSSGCAVVGAGASGPRRDITTPLSEAVEVDQLAKSHTQYLGDNSADAAILDALHLEVVGARTFELVTDKKPYELKINFSTSADGLTSHGAHEALRKRAVLAMACIDNLDKVSWKVPHVEPASGSLTRADAQRLAGSTLNCDKDALTALAKKLDA